MNETNEAELKPCPFCGCTDIIEEKSSHSKYPVVFSCNGCWAQSSYEDTRSEAIAAWNTRHQQSNSEPLTTVEGLLIRENEKLEAELAALKVQVGDMATIIDNYKGHTNDYGEFVKELIAKINVAKEALTKISYAECYCNEYVEFCRCAPKCADEALAKMEEGL